MSQKKKWPKIDLIHFIANNTYNEWNKFLTKSEYENNYTAIVSVFYGLQVGMQVAVKNKVSTPFIVDTFIRLQRSAEKTLKRMYRKQHGTLPTDVLSNDRVKEILQKKRNVDNDFEKWLKLQRY